MKNIMVYAKFVIGIYLKIMSYINNIDLAIRKYINNYYMLNYEGDLIVLTHYWTITSNIADWLLNDKTELLPSSEEILTGIGII